MKREMGKEDDRENGGGDGREIKEAGVRKSCHKRAATKRTSAQGSGYKY